MTNETVSFTNKIQVSHFDSDYSIVQDDHYGNNNNNVDDCQTQCIDAGNNSEDKSYGELNSSRQVNGMESNKTVNQENQILITMGTSNFTNISANKHAGLTSTSAFIQGFFYSIYTKPYLLFCIYVISMKTSLQLYTYYHLYKCL